mmetsp:Transcript_23829/g.38403  ORF Transcript_23829/g.38403 Transcript_23829/m.38403 type:complete len:107 (-) Transcript_23829:767-1087(-)
MVLCNDCSNTDDLTGALSIEGRRGGGSCDDDDDDAAGGVAPACFPAAVVGALSSISSSAMGVVDMKLAAEGSDGVLFCVLGFISGVLLAVGGAEPPLTPCDVDEGL